MPTPPSRLRIRINATSGAATNAASQFTDGSSRGVAVMWTNVTTTSDNAAQHPRTSSHHLGVNPGPDAIALAREMPREAHRAKWFPPSTKK